MRKFNQFLFLAFLVYTLTCCQNKDRKKEIQQVDVEFIGDNLYEKDEELLDKTQQECFSYIWEHGHPVSGLAFESNQDESPVSIGATGFGVASIVVAAHRGWITREEAVQRILQITNFLKDKTERKKFHGAFPALLDGNTGKGVAPKNAVVNADLVETSFLIQGLLIARSYFIGGDDEKLLRGNITEIWREVEWSWFANEQSEGLYRYWSPEANFKGGRKIRGFNDAFITYILALSSPTYPITKEIYDYWTSSEGYKTNTYNGYTIEAASNYTGPLSYVYYPFVGLNPHLIADQYVTEGYWVRNIKQVLINRAYCLETASKINEYSESYWGLTGGDVKGEYQVNSPESNQATIVMAAALASIPYTPHYSMEVLWEVYSNYRNKMWGVCGPHDSYSLRYNWYSQKYIGMNQLVIPCMIENYRSGLLWLLFMEDKNIQYGLSTAGIHRPVYEEGFPEVVVTLKPTHGKYAEDAYDIRRHPYNGYYQIPYYLIQAGTVNFQFTDQAGNVVHTIEQEEEESGRRTLSFYQFADADKRVYRLTMTVMDRSYSIPVRMN